jgi:hypothetical protein
MNLQQAALNRQMFQPQPAINQNMSGLRSGIMNVGTQANNIQTQANNTQTANEVAKKFGLDNLSATIPNLGNVTSKAVSSMATDNIQDVDENLQKLYSDQPELAQIIGAMNQVSSREDDLVKLYKDLNDNLVKTPEEAKQRVKEFFPNIKSQQTPVWADVAVDAGIELIASGDIGQALKKGSETAKISRTAKAQQDMMLNQLAFGVYKEDAKQADTIRLNLAKMSLENTETALNYKAKIAKIMHSQFKLEKEEASKKSNLIMDIINSYPADQRDRVSTVITQNLPNVAGLNLEGIRNAIHGEINKKLGTDFQLENDTKFLTSETIEFNTEEEFNKFKTLYPTVFGDTVFKPDVGNYKLKISGLDSRNSNTADYLKGGNALALVQPIGKLTGFSQLLNEAAAAQTALSFMNPNNKNYSAQKELVDTLNKRIDKLTKEESTTAVVVTNDGTVAVGRDVKGAYEESQMQQIQQKTIAGKTAFARLGGLAFESMLILDGLSEKGLVSPGGLTISLARGLRGLEQQFGNIREFFEKKHDTTAYFGNDFSNLYDSKVMSGVFVNGKELTSGDYFQKFDNAIGTNRELRSLLTDMAFALASTRETGKLTDKDIAYALNTIGGQSIVEDQALPTVQDIKTGLVSALNLANQDFGSYMNTVLEPAKNKMLKDAKANNTEADLSSVVFDPIRILKNNPTFAGDNWIDQIVDTHGRLSFNQEALNEVRKARRIAAQSAVQTNVGELPEDIQQTFESYENQLVQLGNLGTTAAKNQINDLLDAIAKEYGDNFEQWLKKRRNN